MLIINDKKGLQMKLYAFVATVCLALSLSTAAVAGNCDGEKRLNALAMNIYYEARGEPADGMRMVGEVTLNRVASSRYPNNICDVVYQRKQFSWVKVNGHKIPKDSESWEAALSIAEELLTDNKKSYAHLATHFLNSAKLKTLPRWARSFCKVERIGNHTFYRKIG